MNHQSLFSGKNKKNINTSSAESVQKVVKVKKLRLVLSRGSLGPVVQNLTKLLVM